MKLGIQIVYVREGYLARKVCHSAVAKLADRSWSLLVPKLPERWALTQSKNRGC
jgi:hypothetical protein